MSSVEQRLARVRDARAAAEAVISAQKQCVVDAREKELALEEELDYERTKRYKDQYVRGYSMNGTVLAVKLGMVYVVWIDGSNYEIEFEALDAHLERYKAWADGVLEDWGAPSGADLAGLPLVAPEPAADATPELSSPRSVVATPLITEATPTLQDTEGVVAGKDDKEPVVEDVVAATGGHKAAGETLPTRQAIVEEAGADAAQGEEAGGAEGNGEPLDADAIEAVTGSGAKGVVEVASCQELGDEAMEEGDDDTASCVQEGIVEADVDDVLAGATGAVEVGSGAVEESGGGVKEGVGDGAADVACAIVPVTAGPLAVISTGVLDQFLDVGDLIEAHYGHGRVEGKICVRKAKEIWSKGIVMAVHRASASRVRYEILYDDGVGTYETGVPASCVRRRSADGCPGHSAHGHSAHLQVLPAPSLKAPEVDTSTTFEGSPATALKPPPKKKQKKKAPACRDVSRRVDKKRPSALDEAPPSKKKVPAVAEAALVVEEQDYKPPDAPNVPWHPKGSDLCWRPLVNKGVCRSVVVGWLPADESGFVDVNNKPAALYMACVTSGRFLGTTHVLQEYQVHWWLVPNEFPSDEDYVALTTFGISGGGGNRLRWTTEFGAKGGGAGDDALPNYSQKPIHVLLDDARIGRWIEVYWAGDGEWFLGRVAGQKIMIGGAVQLLVKYDDGEEYYEALQDEPYAGAGAPPDDGVWYFRFVEPRKVVVLESLAPPEFPLCREISEAAEAAETPRLVSNKRSLTVKIRFTNAKKQKTQRGGTN